ncbi:MAG: hypothetical protein GEV06_06595 [Luteitalea sp.]|nr:hypothetical protein [Luteitalea sp.]
MSLSWLKSYSRRWRGQTGADARDSGPHRQFRAAVQEGLAGDRTTLEGLLQMPGALGIADEEVELELEMVQGALDLLALKESLVRDGLPVLEHQHKALGADRCHFRCSAFTVDESGHRPGRLFLTHRRVIFLASPLLAVPWSAALSINDEERDIVVSTVTPGVAYRFHCNSFSDARCGVLIAQTLMRQARPSLEPERR